MAGRALALGIDLSGSKVLSALVDQEGATLALAEARTRKPVEQALALVEETAHRALKTSGADKSSLLGVGLGVAGLCDSSRGLVIDAPNLGWRDVPFGEMAQARLGLPVIMDNDAHVTALGEFYFGAGRGARNLVCVIIGTGIGGGLILNGRPYRGTSGVAGEIGHTALVSDGPPCACGRRGCWESLASGTAIVREAQAGLKRGEHSSLSQLSPAEITAEAVAQAAREGDKLALKVIEQAAFYLGVGLGNLLNIFNPERILLGGRVANIGSILLEPALLAMEERAFAVAARACSIIPTSLGDRAGALGAAALILQARGLLGEIL